MHCGTIHTHALCVRQSRSRNCMSPQASKLIPVLGNTRTRMDRYASQARVQGVSHSGLNLPSLGQSEGVQALRACGVWVTEPAWAGGKSQATNVCMFSSYKAVRMRRCGWGGARPLSSSLTHHQLLQNGVPLKKAVEGWMCGAEGSRREHTKLAGMQNPSRNHTALYMWAVSLAPHVLTSPRSSMCHSPTSFLRCQGYW